MNKSFEDIGISFEDAMLINQTLIRSQSPKSPIKLQCSQGQYARSLTPNNKERLIALFTKQINDHKKQMIENMKRELGEQGYMDGEGILKVKVNKPDCYRVFEYVVVEGIKVGNKLVGTYTDLRDAERQCLELNINVERDKDEDEKEIITYPVYEWVLVIGRNNEQEWKITRSMEIAGDFAGRSFDYLHRPTDDIELAKKYPNEVPLDAAEETDDLKKDWMKNHLDNLAISFDVAHIIDNGEVNINEPPEKLVDEL